MKKINVYATVYGIEYDQDDHGDLYYVDEVNAYIARIKKIGKLIYRLTLKESEYYNKFQMNIKEQKPSNMNAYLGQKSESIVGKLLRELDPHT